MTEPTEPVDGQFLTELSPGNSYIEVNWKARLGDAASTHKGYYMGVAVDGKGREYLLLSIYDERATGLRAVALADVAWIHQSRRDYVEVNFKERSPDEIIRDLKAIKSDTHA